MKEKIITIVLSIIIFAVPLLIIPNSEDYYNFARYILLLICGLALLVMFFINIKNIKCDTTDTLILIFIILGGISTIFSLNIKTSIFGEKNRYEGLLTLITYGLIYYNTKYYFKGNKKILNIGLILYSVIFIIAIIQFYMPARVLYIIPIFGKGAHGTIGNTNFMGSFVSILLPCCAFCYIFTGKYKFFIPSLLGFTVMLMCIARSSWVAFAAYGLIGLIYVIVNKRKEIFKRFFILLLGFVLCFSIMMLTEKSKTIVSKANIVTNEIKKANTTGVSKEMGSGRIWVWQITCEVIQKVPLVGCGVDALKYGIKTHATKSFIEFVKVYKQYIDKAHNEYLHIAATIGLPALGVYLCFIVLILDKCRKAVLTNRKNMLFFLSIIGYLVQAFFNISVIAVAPIFWFALGLSQNKELELLK